MNLIQQTDVASRLFVDDLVAIHRLFETTGNWISFIKTHFPCVMGNEALHTHKHIYIYYKVYT